MDSTPSSSARSSNPKSMRAFLENTTLPVVTNPLIRVSTPSTARMLPRSSGEINPAVWRSPSPPVSCAPTNYHIPASRPDWEPRETPFVLDGSPPLHFRRSGRLGELEVTDVPVLDHVVPSLRSHLAGFPDLRVRTAGVQV